jgi:excinuclease UvrABC nuclease subunit
MRQKMLEFLSEHGILDIKEPSWNYFKITHAPPENESVRRNVRKTIKNITGLKNGIYVYKDFNDIVLYIGKAKPLKNRLYDHYMESFRQSSGDRTGRWFRFFQMYQGEINVYWKEVEDETIRIFVESVLTEIHKPVFLDFEKRK